ncbi:MAG TPA: RES domain-containing protein [Acidisoma sp.]|uniref:RES family NAD+ phosphorylase n=1 Tax=Acidisoma sp. TaxID=1872115 RepID=UPI002BFF12A0|nr:RES domain-containing protein [Acidisoma sp.]HTI00733.1 RES domain-containing protein [Acidisoma sp.]
MSPSPEPEPRTGWRLCREPFADLTGQGAALYGGRWNSPGTPLVYLAANAALALLEVRVHLDLPPDLLPDDYVLLSVGLDGLSLERLETLPEDPRGFGDRWLAEGRTALLDVPSVLVPESRNLLLNPRHKEAGQARILHQRRFAFDPRLWLGG